MIGYNLRIEEKERTTIYKTISVLLQMVCKLFYNDNMIDGSVHILLPVKILQLCLFTV